MSTTHTPERTANATQSCAAGKAGCRCNQAAAGADVAMPRRHARRRSHAFRSAAFAAFFVLLAAPALFAQGPGGPGGPGGGMPGHPGGMTGSPGMGRPGPPPNGGNHPGNNPGNGTPTGSPLGPHLAGPAGRWWDEGKYARTVGLTGEQQRRMDTVFQENRSALVSGLDNLRKAQARLDTLSGSDHPSEAAMLTEIQNVAQARADLAKASTHMQLQIRNEMTNDQIDKLEKLK